MSLFQCCSFIFPVRWSLKLLVYAQEQVFRNIVVVSVIPNVFLQMIVKSRLMVLCLVQGGCVFVPSILLQIFTGKRLAGNPVKKGSKSLQCQSIGLHVFLRCPPRSFSRPAPSLCLQLAMLARSFCELVYLV